jgi:Uma2 family endonuclease
MNDAGSARIAAPWRLPLFSWDRGILLFIMMQALSSGQRRFTVEEYFKIDSDSHIRHEYVNGKIIDMAGGTDRHSQIIHNVHGSLWARLRGKPCQGRDGNLRIRVGRKVIYGYPDALIVCGQPQFDPAGAASTTLLNPRVLFEVLSESTEAYDRGLKFERYREIESFEEYVLIAQDRPSVEVYRRQPSGLWTLQPYLGIETSAEVLSAGIELPLTEIYAGIEFAPEAEPEAPKSDSV